jgi:regulatory protein YycH of two-component signal transduction system YycFG
MEDTKKNETKTTNNPSTKEETSKRFMELKGDTFEYVPGFGWIVS